MKLMVSENTTSDGAWWVTAQSEDLSVTVDTGFHETVAAARVELLEILSGRVVLEWEGEDEAA